MTKIHRRHRAAVGRPAHLPGGPPLPHGVQPAGWRTAALQRRQASPWASTPGPTWTRPTISWRRGPRSTTCPRDPDGQGRVVEVARGRSTRRPGSPRPARRPAGPLEDAMSGQLRAGFQEDYVHLTADAADLPGAGGLKLVGIDYLSVESSAARLRRPPGAARAG